MIEPNENEKKWYELGGRVQSVCMLVYLFPVIYFMILIMETKLPFYPFLTIALLGVLVFVVWLVLHFTGDRLEKKLRGRFYVEVFKEVKPVA